MFMILCNVRHHVAKAVIVIFSTAICAGNLYADDLQDVKSLVKEGKLADALVKANKSLEKQQADPSMQFVKGLILSEQKKNAEAIEVFSKLTIDQPNYPEPYNNLAVLFATEGQYSKARIALETALKLNPKYVTAQENLGDVYLQSAMQAYIDAAKNDGDSLGIKSKLKSIRLILGSAAVEQPNPSVTKTSPSKVGSTQTLSKASESPADAQHEREAVLNAVNQWVQAWSKKDIKGYLGLYSSDFQTPNGESRRQWENSRRARINGKDQIEIQVLSPSVTVEDDLATVNFQQIYMAGKISSNARKTLTLKNEDGKWKIMKEKSEN
jgi:tetratricopeptide (TPR) repeat protein